MNKQVVQAMIEELKTLAMHTDEEKRAALKTYLALYVECNKQGLELALRQRKSCTVSLNVLKTARTLIDDKTSQEVVVLNKRDGTPFAALVPRGCKWSQRHDLAWV